MPEPVHPDVCVVGAGPAGLLCALALARRGHEVVVLERRAELQPPRVSAGPGPGGAPGLQPVTLGLLDAAGVLDAVRPVSAVLGGAEIYLDGRLRAARHYADVPGAPVPHALSVPVTELVRALLDRALAEPGLRILPGVTATLRSGAGGRFAVDAGYDDGSLAVEPRYVVACDGKHSAVRAMAGIDAETFRFENGYLEVPLPMPSWWGTTMRAYLSEHGYVLATPVAGPELLLVWITEAERLESTLAAGAPAIAEALSTQMPNLADWIAEHARGTTGRTVPHEIVRPRRWSLGNLVLVGDSAHGLHAMGGQGLNTSLQDALCTADALDDAVRTSDMSTVDELHAARRPFIEAFQDQQSRRASGAGDGLPTPDLDVLALGQPELRGRLARAAATLAGTPASR